MNIIVTGASSGIGESTARLLAGKGAKVVLGARRKDRIDAVVNDVGSVKTAPLLALGGVMIGR